MHEDINWRTCNCGIAFGHCTHGHGKPRILNCKYCTCPVGHEEISIFLDGVYHSSTDRIYRLVKNIGINVSFILMNSILMNYIRVLWFVQHRSDPITDIIWWLHSC
jgi:hypothetical protein